MYVKSVELDGFKSYARREKIEGFDEQFNAITGLNGSGKSNILDSICFVLGISKLDAIRAKNLTDLIFKQGQAGITKATVSITFDNSDKKQSPIGYSNCNEIVVRRQVQVGGKSTYQVNGVAQSNTKVIDLFRSVSLNVNNPHFLIMQGRITKVLNMKPIEILGMIEEAAGTKLYEQRKDEAIRTIKNKDIMLNEINETNSEECEKEGNALVDEMKVLEEEIKACEEEMEKLQEQLAEIEAEKSKDNGMGKMEEQQKTLQKELAIAESERDGVAGQQKKDEQEIGRIKKSIDGDHKVMAKKEKELEKIKKDNEQDIGSTADDEKKVEDINKQLDALAQGMTTDDQGNAITFEKKIQDYNAEANNYQTTVTQDQKKIDVIKKNLREAEKELGSLGSKSNKDADDEKNKKKELDNIQTDIGRLNFDSNRDAQLTKDLQDKRTEQQNVRGDIEQIRTSTSQTYGNLFYKYHTNDSRFDHSDVVGPLATLIKVKDPKWNYAVQIAGGQNVSV
ncbi:hypothetical protein WR25_07080 [Diploscapter pachys]|uniref:RecF/RecN/SMC N-terminal domain-containing protein n=1 Tax=Diploscapter pachys TaxID=2018661 RepID=A0A2A2LMC4_9BILA|nr:hypothetical protein WR25_07080 [Diploscapter pachys]